MSHPRNVYLSMKSLEQACDLLMDRFGAAVRTGTETVPVPASVGRTLAEPVFARISSPNFHAAAMDGIAVKAAQTYAATEGRPLTLKIGQDASYINTGNVLPEGTDAVIMIEYVNQRSNDVIEIEAPAYPWQNVRKMGEDIVATELLFPRHHLISSYCIGALLTGGIFGVAVQKKPQVLIIPTGSELVDWRGLDHRDLLPGQVIESNSWVLEALIAAVGGEAVRRGTLRDDRDSIQQVVQDAVDGDFDMVLIIGGSSAGSEDFARPVITALGQVIVHGVTIMPGKPVIIGDIRQKPVFGIPGYPVSAIICFEQFVKPLLLRMLGRPDQPPQTVEVVPTRKIPSKLGVEEFLRVKLGRVFNRIVATPLPRGAGSVTSITEADGIIRIPSQSEGVNEGETVIAELLKPPASIEDTLVIVGSHDNTLDILADQLRQGSRHLYLSSSHVGSLGGLMAIKKGGCHLAGAHLLNTEDGSYNISYIRKYLAELSAVDRIRLVHLVMREQGMIVSPGNPKGIKGIEDLCRAEVRMINRQNGSGTRILLDYRLEQEGIDRSTINGYRSEEFTHMSVAAAVLSGRADVGIGILAAAKALDLEFIPIVTEQYDLVIPQDHFETEKVNILLDTIRSSSFKQRVEALGGYHTQKTGEILL